VVRFVLKSQNMNELRLGLRFLTRAPGYYALCTITLALGIGIATLMFSVTESVLWRPLPLPHPEQLVMVYDQQIKNPMNNTGSAAADFLDWRTRARSFAGMGALTAGEDHTLTGAGERVRPGAVSSGFFATLGVQPILGREFAPSEEASNVHAVILTYGFWRSHFAGASDAIGRNLELDRQPYLVVGILPESFRVEDVTGMGEPAFYVPLGSANVHARRSNRNLAVFARRKPGVSLSAAAAEMHSIARQITTEDPENAGWDARVDDLREAFTKYNRTVLYLFLGFSTLVLAVAAANVGGLGLVRSVGRQREYVLRLALGAGSAGLQRLALAESFWLAVPSSLGGLLLAAWGLEGVRHLMPAGFLTRADQIALDWRAAGFVLVVSLAIAAMAAVVPTFLAIGPRAESALRAGSRTVSAPRHTQLVLHGLIATEMALSLVLLFAAGLFVSSNARLEKVELGFDARDLLIANVTSAQSSLFPEALRRGDGIRGVRAMAVASAPPLSGGEWIRYRADGRAYARREEQPDSLVRVVTPGYFDLIGARLLLGRPFSELDSANAGRVAIVNENLANSAFPGENPIGKILTIDSDDTSIASGPVRIIGLAANTRELGLSEVPFEDIFLPFAQNPRRTASLLVKYAGASGAVAAALRSELLRLDPDAAVYGVRTMEEAVDQNFRGVRFRMSIVTLFAALAVLLAAVGVYGAISFSVAQRRREFALRIALGAVPAAIRRIAVARVARVTATAAIAGTAVALVIGRLLGSALYLVPHQHTGVLYGVSTHDPLSMVAAVGAVGAIALAASVAPASRAARVEPVEELRSE
jgi:putative ABC transport system permease protein